MILNYIYSHTFITAFGSLVNLNSILFVGATSFPRLGFAAHNQLPCWQFQSAFKGPVIAVAVAVAVSLVFIIQKYCKALQSRILPAYFQPHIAVFAHRALSDVFSNEPKSKTSTLRDSNS